MKNTFKIFGLMLLAGTLVLSSCKDEEETTPGVNPETGKPQYTITVTSNNDAWGTVSGGGTYDSGAAVTLTATPKDGYQFVNWNTGATNNPLAITATENATYTANFEEFTGVQIQFGDVKFKANYTNGLLYSNAVMISGGQTDATHYPLFRIAQIWDENVTPSTGSYTGTPSMTAGQDDQVSISFGTPNVWYFEQGVWQLGNTQSGDWWGTNVSMNLTALDADAMTVSMAVNATMVYVFDIINEAGQLTSLDFNDCTHRSAFTANVKDQTLTRPSSKAKLVNHATATIAR